MTNPFRRIYNEDQEDRTDVGRNPALVVARDRGRLSSIRSHIIERLRAGGRLEPEEMVCAAMIYQHGTQPEHYAMAHLLAWQAHQLGFEGGKDRGLPYALWLAAAARDRWQTCLRLPQDFGTQYLVKDGVRERMPTNPAITDEERERWHVPPMVT